MTEKGQIKGRNNRSFPEEAEGGLGIGHWNGKEAAGLTQVLEPGWMPEPPDAVST